jgi:hypothetical protein
MVERRIPPVPPAGKKERPTQGDNTDTRIVDGILDEEDLEELRAMARKQVELEFKAAARQEKLKEMVAEERSKLDPEEEMVDVLIDLPGHAENIMINFRKFHHGHRYTVGLSQYRTLADIQARAWEHEEVVGNVNRSRYQPVQRGTRVNASTMQVTNPPFLRA